MNQSTTYARTCLTCGTPFLATDYQVKTTTDKFCSDACIRYNLPLSHTPIIAGVPLAPDEGAVTRFWSYVRKTAICWIWTGGLRNAYGYFYHEGQNYIAHRFSYTLHYGGIPEGFEVCHNCPRLDTPFCVNPAHLFAASHHDNIRDAVQKGRMRNRVLTPEQRIDLYAAFAVGEHVSVLAQRFDLTMGAVYYHRRLWRDHSS